MKAKRHYLEGKNNNKQFVLLWNDFMCLTRLNPRPAHQATSPPHPPAMTEMSGLNVTPVQTSPGDAAKSPSAAADV